MADNTLPEGVFFERPKTDEERRQEYQKNAPPPLPEGTFFQRPKGEKPPVSGFYDAGMGAASGLARGAIGLPGIVGDLRDLASLGALKGQSFLESKITGKPQEDIEKSILASRAKYQEQGPVPTIMDRAPTSHELISAAEKYAPAIKQVTQYEPQTGPGRITKGVGEFLPSAVLNPGTAAERAITGLAAGTTGQLAKEGSRNLGATPGYQTAAEILGTILGGGAASGALSRYAVSQPQAQKELSQQFAGQTLREALQDPAQVQADLARRGQLAAQPGALPQGVNLTPAQLLKSGELENLQQRLIGLDPNSPEAIALKQQVVASKAALGKSASQAQTAIGQNIPVTDISSAMGLSGSNPQHAASIAARTAFDTLEGGMYKTQKDAWQNPLLKQTNVYKDKAVEQIDDYLASIPKLDSDRINPAAINGLNTIRNIEGTTIPLMELQSLRQIAGDASRSAYKSGEAYLGKINQDFATKIYEVLNNDKNIQFGDKSGAKIAAWNDARQATKDYYDTIKPDFMAKLVKKDPSGAPQIAPEAFFDKMLSGPNQVRNLQQIRSALGPTIDNHISDWVMGDLTNNGTKLNIKQSDVSKYLADPKNAAIADEVPGLRDRLNSFAQQVGESEQAAKLRQLNIGFEDASKDGNPNRIANFLNANGDALRASAANPSQAQFIDAVKRAANLMSTPQAGVSSYSKTLDAIQNGRMIDVLLGNKLGAISDATTLELMTNLLSSFSGHGLTPGLGAITGGLARFAGKSPSDFLASRISNLLIGDIRGTTIKELQTAAADPEVMRLLMSKPSPEVAMNLHRRLTAMGIGLEQTNTTPPQDNKRTGRASGGRIGSSSIGDRLVLAAERAKKENSKGTEPLLQVNDESIAKALEIANRNL